MKLLYTKRVVLQALFIAATFQGRLDAVHLRANDRQEHLGPDGHVTTAWTTHKIFPENNHPVCLQGANSTVDVRAANGTHVGAGKKHITTLRVCNAATMDRQADLHVYHNGEEMVSPAIKQRECAEIQIPISATNKIEANLIGDVFADWSGEYSEAEMLDAPIMFLVAYVFGTGSETTYSVDKFSGEVNGLKSSQVAYMDLLRGGSELNLQLVGEHAGFEVPDSRFAHVCPGDYDLRFVPDGGGKASSRAAGAELKAEPHEQYIVLRIAPKGAAHQSEVESGKHEQIIVFPYQKRHKSRGGGGAEAGAKEGAKEGDSSWDIEIWEKEENETKSHLF